MSKIRIVSDGTPMGTKVFNHDGTQIEGVQSIKLCISCDELALAEMTFTDIGCEFVANNTIAEVKRLRRLVSWASGKLLDANRDDDASKLLSLIDGD